MKKSKALSLILSLAMAASSFSVLVPSASADEMLDTAKAKSYNFTATPKDGYTTVSAVTEYSKDAGFGFISTTATMPAREIKTSAITATADGFTTTDASGLVFAVDMADGADYYNVTVETTGTKADTNVAVNGMEASRLVGTSPWDSAGLVAKSNYAKWDGSTWSYNYMSYNGHIEVEVEANKAGAAAGVKSISVAPVIEAPRQKPVSTIFILGDSTQKTYTFEENSMSSYGQTLYQMFDIAGGKVNVINYSMGGRSMRNNYTEGRLNDVLVAGQSGDYVFIHSAHNDETADADSRFGRGSTAETYAKWLNEIYIPAIKARGMIPVLVTAVPRTSGGTVVENTEKPNGFNPDAPGMMRTAAANDPAVELVELYANAKNYYTEIGADAVVNIYQSLEAGESAGKTNNGSYANGHPDNKIDGTHYKEALSKQLSRIIATDINNSAQKADASENMKRLAGYLKPEVRAAAASGDWSAVFPEITNDTVKGEGSKYRNQIEKMVQMGVMAKDAEGNFNPKAAMTVGGFAEALTELWDLDKSVLSDYMPKEAAASLMAGETLSWTCSAADAGCPVGHELFPGLTTLFADDKNDGQYIHSATNCDWSDSAGKATSGAGLKFIAPEDGVITLTLSSLNSGKQAYIIEEGKTLAEAVTKIDGPEAVLSGFVNGGKTYYLIGKGTKPGMQSAKFVPGVPATPSPTPTVDPNKTPEPELIARTPIHPDAALTRQAMAAVIYDAYNALFGKAADGSWNKPVYMTNYNGTNLSPDDPNYDPNLTGKSSQYYPLVGWGALTDTDQINTSLWAKVKEVYNLGLMRSEKGIERGKMVNGTEIEPQAVVTREKAAKELYFLNTLTHGIKEENHVIPDGSTVKTAALVTPNPELPSYPDGSYNPPVVTPEPTVAPPTREPGTLPTDVIWRADAPEVAAYDATKENTINGAKVGPNLTYKTRNSGEYVHSSGTAYNFEAALQGGSGSTSSRYVAIVPEVQDCTVTAVFDGNGAEGRKQFISFAGNVIAEAASGVGVTTVTADLTTADIAAHPGEPIYTYGGGSNKNLYAVFIEYYIAAPDKKLSGKIENATGRDLTGKKIVFTNVADSNEKYTTTYGETYEITLPKGKTFTVSVEGMDDVCTTLATKEIKIEQNKYDQTADLKFVLIKDTEVVGNVYTLSSDDLRTPLYAYDETIGATLAFTKQGEAVPYASAKVNADGSYKVTLMSNESYNVTFSVPSSSEAIKAVSASANETTVTTGDVKGVLAAAQYDAKGNVTAVKTAEVTKAGEYKIALGNTADMKIMLWDSLKGMKPVCGAVSVKAGETSGTASGTVSAGGYSLSPLSKTYSLEGGTEAPYKNILLMKNTAANIEYKETLTVGEGKDYKSVSEAVAAVRKMTRTADQSVTIVIDPGTYEEQVYVDVDNIVMKAADENNKPTISWYYGIGYIYYSPDASGWYNADCAAAKTEKRTVSNWGATLRTVNKMKGFRAENIDFVNTFNKYITDAEIADGVVAGGADAHTIFDRTADKTPAEVKSKAATERAAAIYAGGSEIELYRCSFKSSQDTFGTNASSMYVKECDIAGNTDYICGGNNVYFEDCNLIWTGYSDQSVGGYLTACKTSGPTDHGYYFKNCTIQNSGEEGMQFAAGSWGRNWGGNNCQVIYDNVTIADGAQKPGAWVKMGGELSGSKLYVNGVTQNGASVAADAVDNPNGTMAANSFTAPKAEDFFGGWTPVYYAAK